MKKLILLLFLTLVSCNRGSQYGIPETDPTIIQKNFMKWWIYNCNTIILSSDFKPLDENFQIINKENFLKNLTSGDYISINFKRQRNLL